VTLSSTHNLTECSPFPCCPPPFLLHLRFRLELSLTPFFPSSLRDIASPFFPSSLPSSVMDSFSLKRVCIHETTLDPFYFLKPSFWLSFFSPSFLPFPLLSFLPRLRMLHAWTRILRHPFVSVPPRLLTLSLRRAMGERFDDGLPCLFLS